jgi:hypothetical protein
MRSLAGQIRLIPLSSLSFSAASLAIVYGWNRKAEEGLVMAFSNLLRWQAEELHAQIARGEKIFVVDVRSLEDRTEEPEEIPGARWVPLANLSQHRIQLPRDATVVTYCT